MKLWSAILITAIIFVAAALLDGQAPAPPRPDVPAAPAIVPPRFQLMELRNSSEIWIFDNQTADSWRFAGNRWTYMGNPTQDPGTKLPAPYRPRAATPPAPVLPESPRP